MPADVYGVQIHTAPERPPRVYIVLGDLQSGRNAAAINNDGRVRRRARRRVRRRAHLGLRDFRGASLRSR